MWKPPEALRERWKASDFQLERVAIDALLMGRIEKAGLGTHQGRVDLRAFDTPPNYTRPRPVRRLGARLLRKPSPTELRPSDLRAARLQSLDFTYGRLPSLIFDEVSFVDCLFDRADLEGTRFVACRFESCSFARADLSGISLGHCWTPGGCFPSSFIDCSFASTTLTNAYAYGSVFVRCDFSRARFRHSCWYGVRFADCAFVGEISEAEFHSTDFEKHVAARHDSLDGADLSKASLRWCEFGGMNLVDVKFPKDDDHLVIGDYRCFGRALINGLQAPRTGAGKFGLEIMGRNLERMGPAQKVGVLNLRDWLDTWDDPIWSAELEAAVRSALAECGQVGALRTRR